MGKQHMGEQHMGEHRPDTAASRDRRAFIRGIAAGSAFVAPLVASFSTSGLSFNMAEASPVGGNQPVPEPSSIALLAVGAAGAAAAVGLSRRARKKRNPPGGDQGPTAG